MKKKIKVFIGYVPSSKNEEKGVIKVVTYEMFPDQYIKQVREFVKVFHKNKKLHTLEIYTMSDMVVRELSNMLMAYAIPKIHRMQYLVRKGFNKKDAKHYYIDVDSIDVKCVDGKKVKVTQEQGIYARIFDKGIDEQNDMQGELYEQIFKEKRRRNGKSTN